LGLQVYIKDERGVSYEFTLDRKVSFLRGDSGTGKTTLRDMVRESRNKARGIIVQCKLEVVDYMHKNRIKAGKGALIVVDEDDIADGLTSTGLAMEIASSPHFWLIIGRHDFPDISYSMDSVYEVVGGEKHKFRRMFTYGKRALNKRPDKIVTEDSRSGKDLIKIIYRNTKIESSGGNGNIERMIKSDTGKEVTLYVVDAEGFGPYANAVEKALLRHKNKYLLAPRSMEYVLLNNGMFDRRLRDEMNKSKGIQEIVKIYSWERQFNKWIREWSAGTPAAYNKDRLKQCYKCNCCVKGKMVTGKCVLISKIDKIGRYIKMFEEMEGNGNASRLL
jgi:hypothetical protein